MHIEQKRINKMKSNDIKYEIQSFKYGNNATKYKYCSQKNKLNLN